MNMKRTNQQSILGFFSKKERPIPHELVSKDNGMSPCDTESHHEEIAEAGPSTKNDDEPKKGKYFICVKKRCLNCKYRVSRQRRSMHNLK